VVTLRVGNRIMTTECIVWSAVKRTADWSGGVGRTGFIAGLSTGAAHPTTGIAVFSLVEAEVRGFGLLPDEMGFATLTLRSTHPTG